MTDPQDTQKDQAADEADEVDPPLNRAQRREQARGKGRTSPRRQDNFMSMAENQAQAETVESADDKQSDAPTESTAGESRLTGPGTGGATESAERSPEHEARDPQGHQRK
ncbi:MAG: hypothetical protein H0W00_01115 [Chloroflexi bacterium]|nr:hypothetical protein [Chloroflexota bacterium]MDQ3448526.1 hypothetical protein [Chloroflexota bacterium]